MSVNGTEIAIGQRWLTRGGQEVEIIDNDGDHLYPWDLSNNTSVTNQGTAWDGMEDPDDLIILVQDEHGFIPWNGGECPVGDVKIEYKIRSNPAKVFEGFPDGLRWNHKALGGDIIAYRVVKQEVESVEADIKEEPKYTVEQVFDAINAATDEFAPRELAAVKGYLAKTQDPQHQLYLELKAKFEKE